MEHLTTGFVIGNVWHYGVFPLVDTVVQISCCYAIRAQLKYHRYFR